MGKFKKLLDEFRKMKLPDKEYIVYGSGPLGVRKIREVRDLDVFAIDDLYKKLKEKYPQNINSREKKIEIGEIEIYSPLRWDWKDSVGDLKDVIGRGELIDGIRFICLKDLMICKKEMGRQKDFEDIKLIENYLKLKKVK